MLLCSKHPFQILPSTSFKPKRLLYVLKKKMYIFSSDLSRKVRTSIWHNDTTNRTMIAYTIFNRTVKISARKFITPYPDATTNKRICFLSSWFNKNNKNVSILPFVQLYVSIENEPKVCDTYCTMDRLFCASKVTKDWMTDLLMR